MKITDKIGIFPNSKKDLELIKTNELLSLLFERECEIYLPVEAKQYIDERYLKRVSFVSVELFYEMATMMITLGGDGTILRAAKNAKCPIIGINMGRLGFIAELKKDEINKIAEIFEGNYKIEKRAMISCSIERGEKITEIGNALNDVVFCASQVGKMTRFEVMCDGVSAIKYFGDGLIIATPTGSSAYSMAAGGPIIAPNATSICVTPICPHSLTARPVIFADTGVVSVKNFTTKARSVALSLDGDASFEVFEGDIVNITKSQKVTYLIKLGENRFYETLYSKISEN